MSFDLIVSLVKENFPNWQAVMLIKSYKEFNALYSPDSRFRGHEDRHYYLDHIAALISVRYTSIGFDQIMDGLKTTINIFGNHLMLVTSIDEIIFAVILPKQVDLTEVNNTFQEIVKQITRMGLSEIEWKKTDIQW